MSDTVTRRALVIPVSGDTERMQAVVIDDQGKVQEGDFTRIHDGEPIPENHVCLSPESGTPFLRAEFRTLAGGDGPAQVATDAYRTGWDRIFGKKIDIPEA